jgi:hypothetical protein
MRAPSLLSRMIGAAVTGVALVSAAPALVASCSSSSSSGPSGADATAEGAAGDGSADAALSCAARTYDANGCSDDGSSFVYYPPLACDPSMRAEAGAVAGDGGVDPCLGTSFLDVYFTPQACRAFVAAEVGGNLLPDTDPSAPIITEPADGDQLTPDNWSIFFWSQPAGDVRRDPLHRALELVEPSAYAYSPLRGAAYVLEFTQGCDEILRVMTAVPYWEPDPASWAFLSSRTGPVRIQVFAMHFSSDVLVGTPVPSLPITITMTGHEGG